MLNRLWGALLLVAILSGLVRGVLGEPAVINAMAASIFDSAKSAIEIAIGLIGSLVLWLGLFAIAEAAGIVHTLARLTRPILGKLLPDVPKDHPSFASISLNLAMSMLGIDNGALPSGLKAMRELESLNTTPGVATKAQQVFLVYMTTSVTLFPISIISYRVQAGAANPADILVPLILTGFAGLFAGLLYIGTVLRLPVVNARTMLGTLIFTASMAALGLYSSQFSATALGAHATLFGNVCILAAILCFIGLGLRRKVPVFEAFTRGATEGFEMAVALMPYLVGMLVAIGLLKSSGVFVLLQSALTWIFQGLGIDTVWVQAVPHGVMKLFSGGGARSMMIESFKTNGPDSLMGHLSSMVQGAFDTTFYILAVCAAAGRLTQLGHAVIGALLANLTSFVMAVFLTRVFFG